MNAADLSERFLCILKHLYHYGELPTKTLVNDLEIKNTTLRQALQRLEAFGLIDVLEDASHRFLYGLSKEGKQLIGRYLKAQRLETVGKTTQPTNVEIHAQIAESIKQRPDIVSWLRSMAVAFNNMADEMAG